jgi:ubiquitin thioesterase CYLD
MILATEHVSGEQNGYNIPEVSLCPELPHWLSEQGARGLPEVRDERQLPERAKRLLCDAYMCFYQSPDVAMYH